MLRSKWLSVQGCGPRVLTTVRPWTRDLSPQYPNSLNEGVGVEDF